MVHIPYWDYDGIWHTATIFMVYSVLKVVTKFLTQGPGREILAARLKRASERLSAAGIPNLGSNIPRPPKYVNDDVVEPQVYK